MTLPWNSFVFKAALGVAWFANLFFTGCSASKNQSLHIVVSGDTAGWITPCGCAINQSGGLERRASLLKSLGSSDRVIYLDAGGSAVGKSEYQTVKLESLLKGDVAMGMEVHNIGASETMLAPEVLKGIAKSTGIVWLSSNLESTDGLPADWVSSRVIVRDGVKVLVAGVIDGALVKNARWRAKDPSTSILSIVSQQSADVVVVLAYMDEPALRALAESLPEVDYIVGGPTGQSMPPTHVGPVQVMSATNKGKFMADIELRKNTTQWQTKNIGAVEVKSTWPRDPTQTKNIDAFLSTLARRDFPAQETELVSNTALNADRSQQYEIAGSDTCTKCHLGDDATWHHSKHAHAWKTIVDKRSHVDPSCQQCHTTGYALPGGFSQVSNSERVTNVGCENCHGPSQSHVLNPKSKTPYLAREQCVRCHDHENSPEFAFPAYWPKVIHGREK